MVAGYWCVYSYSLVITITALFSICGWQYTTYKIEKETPNTLYPFVFNNIMGLSEGKGVLVDDVKLALKGHVKENYKV